MAKLNMMIHSDHAGVEAILFYYQLQNLKGREEAHHKMFRAYYYLCKNVLSTKLNKGSSRDRYCLRGRRYD
jgi:hypothetical protein